MSFESPQENRWVSPKTGTDEDMEHNMRILESFGEEAYESKNLDELYEAFKKTGISLEDIDIDPIHKTILDGEDGETTEYKMIVLESFSQTPFNFIATERWQIANRTKATVAKAMQRLGLSLEKTLAE